MDNENDYETGLRVTRRVDQLPYIELVYPTVDNHPDGVEIGLECVRGADDIRVRFSHDRDEWIVERPKNSDDLDEWIEVFSTPACVD